MKGPSLGRRLLVYGGYTVFFLGAFVVSVYLTLPLDTVKSYLVRKAADEHGADLVIGELSTWGLSGIEAENVTLTFRPTPEEEAALEAAREARKAWEATHGAAAKAKDADAADKVADKVADKSKDPSGEPGEQGAEAAGIEADPAATAPATASAGKTDDTPPPMPVGPRPISVDAVRLKVGLLSLLSGHPAGAVEAAFAGGTLEGELDRSAEGLHVTGKWEAIDLRQLDFLRRHVDLPVAGTLSGDVDVEVPTADGGKMRLPSAQGHVALKVADAAVGPGKVPAKGLGFDTVDLPPVRIAGIDGKLVLEKKRATFEHFDITGKDLEGEITGYIDLKDTFARFGPRFHLRFKFSDEFLEAHKEVKTILTFPRVKQATQDSFIGVMFTGSVADVRTQLRKDSPYKAGATAKAGDRTKPKSEREPKDKKGAKPSKPNAFTGTGTSGTVPRPPLPMTAAPAAAKQAAQVPEPSAPEPAVPEPAAEPEPAVEEPPPAPEPEAEPATAAPEPEPATGESEGEAPAAGGGAGENPEAPAEHDTEGE